MANDAAIVVGVKGDLAGGVAVKTNLDQIKKSGDDVTKGQKALQQEFQKTSSVAKDLTNQVIKLAAAYVSVRTVIDQFNKAIGAGVELQSLNARMSLATSNAQVTTESFKFLNDISKELGLNFGLTAQSFATFATVALRAGLTFGEIKTIFQDVQTVATSFHIAPEQVQQVFDVMQQMASRTNISMQQLQRTLNTALPGAFGIFVASTGKSMADFQKAVEQGQIGIKDLTNFANKLKDELGGNASTAAQQLTAQTNRLTNSVSNLREEFANNGALSGYTDLIIQLRDLYSDAAFQHGVQIISEWTGNFLKGVGAGIDKLREYIELLERYSFMSSNSNMTLFFERMTGQLPVPNGGGNVIGGNDNSPFKTDNNGGNFLLNSMNPPNPFGSNDKFTLGTVNKPGPTQDQIDAAKKIKDVTDELKLQTDNLKRNDIEQAVYNNLKQAGVSIDSEAGQNIAELTRQYKTQAEALVQQKELIDGVGHATEDFFKTWMTGSEGFKGAIKGMIGKLADLAFQMEVIEPIEKNLLGGSSKGTGILGSLFGSIFGGGGSSGGSVSGGYFTQSIGGVTAYADGGSMTIGGNAGVDKNLLSLNGSPIAKVGKGETLTVTPNGKTSGGGGSFTQIINISTGVAASVAAEMMNYVPMIQKSTMAMFNDAQGRGIKA